MSSSNFKNEFAQILIIFWFPAHVCMYDINIIEARDGEDKMANGVGIDLILHDTILISLLADGSKDRIDCGPGCDKTWKCEESKLADLSKVKN
jgi:hypothetical protein